MPKHKADAPEQHQYPSPSMTGGSPTVDLGATEGHAIQAVHEQTQSMFASFQAMMEDMHAQFSRQSQLMEAKMQRLEEQVMNGSEKPSIPGVAVDADMERCQAILV